MVTDGLLGGGGGSSVTYRMRGYDGTLARLVFWTAESIDDTGAEYTGPGPLTDIVVQMIVGT